MSVKREYASWWTETANADNAAATATRNAPTAGQSHYITSIAGSYSVSATSGLMTLSQGATEIGRWYVHDVFAVVLPSPIRIEQGEAVTLELAASGSAGTVGAVTMSGYTV